MDNVDNCKLCGREIKELLTHLYLDHNIKTVEKYEERIKLKYEEDKRVQEYQTRIIALVEMLDRKEINAKEYRLRISTINM